MKKFLLSLFVWLIWFVNFWYCDNISDSIDDWLGVILSVFNFIWALLKFLYFWIKTVFNFAWKAFTYIFSEDLFNSIWDTFQNLSLLMGSSSAIILMSLFFLAFVLVIISFIFKLIKWQVNYRATIKKFEKK